jgi:thiamine biosynthesis lipoprotein
MNHCRIKTIIRIWRSCHWPRLIPARTAVSAALMTGLLCSSCAFQANWRSATFFVFDTVCEVTLLCTKDEFRSAQDTIRQTFSQIDRLFSPGAENYSSSLVLSLFRRAREIHRVSEGSFDISVAPLSKLWGFWSGDYRIPRSEEIQEALQKVGMEKIQEEDSALRLPPGFGLDWGGIAKGFGIDLASRSLMGRGIARGFINIGGDLFCWGENPSGTPWKIGIKHPRKEGYFGVLHISNLGAATAGDYQRFFMENGCRYHHIFDPQTGYPVQGKRSVTVIGPEVSICDALSTALFVSTHPDRIISRYPDYGAIIMDSEGVISVLGRDYPFQALR